MDDDVMARLSATLERGRRARKRPAGLGAMWSEVEQGSGDDFHPCVIAHFVGPRRSGGRDRRTRAAVRIIRCRYGGSCRCST